MRLVIADCSATYIGRGETTLARGTRVLMIKADGSVSIHNDVSNKPLNYMKDAKFAEARNDYNEPVWIYESGQEILEITIHEILMDNETLLVENGSKLERSGTEKHLQDWLSERPELLGKGFRIIGKEFQSGEGPVDLLALDGDGNPVAVEIKRVAMLGAVDQCRRYIDAFKSRETRQQQVAKGLFAEPARKMTNAMKAEDLALSKIIELQEDEIDFSKITGMIAAIDIRPKTLVWASKHNIATVLIPENWRETS